MTKKLLIETPSEQSRLLNEIPEVIAAIEKCDPISEYSPSQDKQGYDGFSESATRESPQTPGTALANGTSWRTNDRTELAGLFQIYVNGTVLFPTVYSLFIIVSIYQ